VGFWSLGWSPGAGSFKFQVASCKLQVGTMTSGGFSRSLVDGWVCAAAWLARRLEQGGSGSKWAGRRCVNRYVNGKVNGYETISVRRNIVGRTNLNSASKDQQFSEALEYFITLVTIQFSGSIFQFVTCYARPTQSLLELRFFAGDLTTFRAHRLTLNCHAYTFPLL
jgi:hypothetical protein